MCVNACLSITAKRQDEDYDEQVEETLQDEVNVFTSGVSAATKTLKSSC